MLSTGEEAKLSEGRLGNSRWSTSSSGLPISICIYYLTSDNFQGFYVTMLSGSLSKTILPKNVRLQLGESAFKLLLSRNWWSRWIAFKLLTKAPTANLKSTLFSQSCGVGRAYNHGCYALARGSCNLRDIPTIFPPFPCIIFSSFPYTTFNPFPYTILRSFLSTSGPGVPQTD